MHSAGTKEGSFKAAKKMDCHISGASRSLTHRSALKCRHREPRRPRVSAPTLNTGQRHSVTAGDQRTEPEHLVHPRQSCLLAVKTSLSGKCRVTNLSGLQLSHDEPQGGSGEHRLPSGRAAADVPTGLSECDQEFPGRGEPL